MPTFMSAQSRRIKEVLRALSATEERRAVKMATTHFFKQSGGNVRYRVIDVSLRIEKPEGIKQIPTRIIQVVFADYTRRRNLAVLVDHKGKVLRDEVLSYQPSLSEEERADAREIALRDDRVASIAKRKGLFVSEVSPLHDVGREARVIGLRYVSLQKSKYIHLATAIISITDQQVAALETSERQPTKRD